MKTTASLLDFSERPVWLAWRYELRDQDGEPTKVPYDPKNGRRGKSNDSATWGTLPVAKQRAKQIINGLGGGVGIVLGVDRDDDLRLGGIDLDTCRNPETGDIEEWAQTVIDRIASYTEASPSQTGVKIFYFYRVAALSRIRELLYPNLHGKTFARHREGRHPPAIQFDISN